MVKLRGENDSYWKTLITDHPYCKDLAEPMINEKRPDGKNENDLEVLNRKGIPMIRKYIDRSLFEHVKGVESADTLWTKLESLIEKKRPRKKAFILRQMTKLTRMEKVWSST